MEDLIRALFKTHAFTFKEHTTEESPEPYSIDITLLYGNKEDRDEIISFIKDQLANNSKSYIPLNVFEKLIDHYDENETYQKAINGIREYIESLVDMKYVDYISGGEGDDWIFSMILAYLFGKPHISIFKDKTVVVTTSDFEEGNEVTKLEDSRIMHIGNTLNEGITHSNIWFSAIRDVGSDIFWNVSIFDFKEGGEEIVKEFNAEPISVLQANEKTFVKGLEFGFLTGQQFAVLRNYAQTLGRND